jgi:hypothetical protein
MERQSSKVASFERTRGILIASKDLEGRSAVFAISSMLTPSMSDLFSTRQTAVNPSKKKPKNHSPVGAR